jgi:hypothetical protein
MTTWRITRTWAIAPPSGAGFDSAYTVRMTQPDETRHDLIIEFAAPSALTSVGYADEIARRFQRDAVPPDHVVVDPQRRVQVSR